LTRYARFEGSELHVAVTDLMLGYREHYELVFPKLPVAPLLLVWIKDLALPRKLSPQNAMRGSNIKRQPKYTTTPRSSALV